jgi:hypothetical protein
VSEANRRCPVASAVASSSTVSGARAPSCRFFFRGMLSLAPSPSTPMQDRRRPPEPLPYWRTPPPIRFPLPPPRRQGAPVSYRLHPHARRVASPLWVLKRHLLLHLLYCSATAGHTPTRARRAVTAPVCARALRRCGPRRSRPARQAVGRARCAHGPSRCYGRGPRATVQLVRTRFRPSDSRISFPFSEYIQILVNLKICVGFI